VGQPKLVAGLGNLPREYEGTRHNVGFEVVEAIAKRYSLDWPKRADLVDPFGSGTIFETRWRRPDGDVVLLKPKTLMNRSGIEISNRLSFYKTPIEEFLVVCDDVNLPLGRLRARARGSEGGHNGLRSITEQLGTTGYARLRVGVGRGDNNRSLSNYVLGRFSQEEESVIESAIARAADAVETWAAEGLDQMMNRFNRDMDLEDPLE
jgi:PTH1 family peptidyl-tRNA hydrolase